MKILCNKNDDALMGFEPCGKNDFQLSANLPTNTPIPHRPRIPRIDKYLDSWLNRTQFVMVLTDSHSP